MDTEKILKAADFSLETNFKEELNRKLHLAKTMRNLNLEDEELDDEELDNIVAARGLNTVPVNFVKNLSEYND